MNHAAPQNGNCCSTWVMLLQPLIFNVLKSQHALRKKQSGRLKVVQEAEPGFLNK